MVINNYRNAEASSFGPGLFLLLVFVLRSGVHSELSDSPALPFYKVGAQRLSCELSYSKYIDFLIFFPLFSMQQGKMFFFIGVTMALIQGGYARRIKPGHHINAVRMVISYFVCLRNQMKISLQTCTL